METHIYTHLDSLIDIQHNAERLDDYRSTRGDEQPGKVRAQTEEEEWMLPVHTLRNTSSGLTRDISGSGKLHKSE